MHPRDELRARRAGLLAVSLAAGLVAACATLSAAPPSQPEASPSLRIAAGADPTATPDAAAATPSNSPSVPATVTATPSRSPTATPGVTALASSTPDLAAGAPEVPRSFDRALRRKLQRIVNGARQRASVPGLAIAVRLPGGETWTAVSGFAELSPDRRVTRDTVFAIASVTKTFVAALIMQLAEEGRLTLDDTLATYLRGAPRARQVTLRRLLAHRSGIYNYFENPRYNRQVFADPDRRWTYEEILGFVKTPYCRPDACYHYSNTNYVLLGRVAEVITGQPLHELLRSRFFDPLGMQDTVYQPDEPTPVDAAHGHWAFRGGFTDHTGSQSVIPTMSAASVAGAAGAIASTASDLARWAAALYGGEVLSSASVRQMTRVLPPDGYGLGTRRVVFLGHEAFGHRGGIRGFESSMWYFPKEDVAIALVSNRGLWWTDPPLLRVIRAVLGPPAQARPEGSPPPSASLAPWLSDRASPGTSLEPSASAP